VVSAGDTLYGIGLRYGVSFLEIARSNHISNPSRIQVGQRILIPGRSSTKQAISRAVPTEFEPHGRARVSSTEPEPGAPSFQWPVPGGTVTSYFGRRNGGIHDGIDISAPVGTPIRAAADGEVAYSGALPGYGNVLILRHGGGFATVYAHNARNRVREGTRVQRGEFIATVGRTGRTSGPNLHFEIRKENIVRDPLTYFSAERLQAASER